MNKISIKRILAALWIALAVLCIGLPLAGFVVFTFYAVAIELTLADFGQAALILLVGAAVVAFLAALTQKAIDILKGISNE